MPANAIAIAFDESQLLRLRARLNAQQYRQAMIQGIKRTGASGKTLASTKIRDVSLAKKKYVDRSIKVRMTYGDTPSGSLIISKEKLSLTAFKYSATKRGVHVQMTKDRGPQWFSHAFVATVNSAGDNGDTHDGHKGIFTRSTHLPTKGPHAGLVNFVKGTNRAAKYTLAELFGPSTYDIAKQPRVTQSIIDGLRASMAENLEKNIGSQISRFS